MGNVLAASPPTTESTLKLPPSPPPTAAPPSLDKPSEAPKEGTPEKGNKLPNPGGYDAIHKKAKELFPQPLSGCKIVITKGISTHFSTSHTLMLDQQQASSYSFNATYVGKNQVGPGESYPVMLGEMDSTGLLNAQFITQWYRGLKSKLVLQSNMGEWQGFQGDLEYRGPSYTAGIAIANPNLLEASGMLVANYLQSITPNLILGSELMHQRSAFDQTTLLSLIGTYQTEKWRLQASASLVGLHLSYYQRSTPNSEVAVEFQSSSVNQESLVTAGYQLDYPKAGATFRASVDTNWSIISTVEKKMDSLPCSIILSALINHSKHRCLFGIGFSLG